MGADSGKPSEEFAQDFRTMNPGLLLLFFVSIGTLVLPPIAAAAAGTDLPPIWALQGLFLFAILIVCGASYQIERFYSVNLAALVVGIAVVAVVVVAPVHAFYRNFHPLSEGRNFYQQSAMELTRQWHRYSDVPLPGRRRRRRPRLRPGFLQPRPSLVRGAACPPECRKITARGDVRAGMGGAVLSTATATVSLDGKDRGARFPLCQIRLRA